jgi:hypothetical protein
MMMGMGTPSSQSRIAGMCLSSEQSYEIQLRGSRGGVLKNKIPRNKINGMSSTG